MMVEISIIASFAAGFFSFLSPCVLPLIPAFLSYLGGVSVRDLQGGKTTAEMRMKIFLNAIFFVIGFSVVFGLVGALLNSILLDISNEIRFWSAKIGGIIIAIFGLFVMGIIRLPFLESEHRLKPVQTKYAYLTSFLFGATFAIGWSPCVGAILGSILTLAITMPGSAFILLVAYAIGLGIPFLVTGAFTPEALLFIQKHGKIARYFNYIMGIVLIILGILVFTETLAQVANLALATEFMPNG